MKWVPLILLVLFVGCNLSKNNGGMNNTFIDTEWVGCDNSPISFKDSIMTFKRRYFYKNSKKYKFSKAKDSHNYIAYDDIIVFYSSGNLAYSKATKQNVPVCGDGIMSLNSGKWTMETDTIVIDVEGFIPKEYEFQYKNEYQIAFPDSNSMRLKLMKVLVSKSNRSPF